jgi:NTE family protein
VLGGGGARGAAQVGALIALFEAGIEPPERLIGVSVGALNGATLAAFPSLAGARMLRESWLSPLARDVFRADPLDIVLHRLRGGPVSALPATNVTRLIERGTQLTGIDTFEGLRVPLDVLATDVGAGELRVFRGGPLLPALLASVAIPGVFPAVEIEGAGYLDGGVIDNLPISHAVEAGCREILAIGLMASHPLERPPRSWVELISRTMQLSLHQRMLSDYERLKDWARIVLICPVLAPGDGVDMHRDRVERIIEAARAGVRRLLETGGRRLLTRSGLHYVPAG